MYDVFRMSRGSDIKKTLEQYLIENGITSAAVVTAVGCVTKATVRMADGITIRELAGNYEIVSLCGTCCRDGCHLHISLSDVNGNVIGGHLCEGTIVNTTLEIVLADLSEEFLFERKYDADTGYRELLIKRI